MAFKRIGEVPEAQRSLVRREISALRILRLPGVARLIDEGVDDGGWFLVMELASGSPFPGEVPDRDWRTIVARAAALLEILERVHAAGILHRDLKPANVLVSPEGRATIVDFGISAGASIDPGMAGLGAGIGTPAFAAPEQLMGQAPDVRSDLYSGGGDGLPGPVGGWGPHDGADLEEVIAARMTDPPRPLSERGPGFPTFLVQALQVLLATRAADRPRSAGDALRLLQGEAVLASGFELPWLDGGGDLAPLLAALEAGSTGAPGGRVPKRAHAHPAASGPGTRRAGTTGGLSGAGPGTVRESRAALRRLRRRSRDPGAGPGGRARRGVSRVLAEGRILVADSGLDGESTALLDGLGDTPGLVRAVEADGPAATVTLAPWSEAQLRPLFAGPDRVLHLVEDPARLLFARTQGRRGVVARGGRSMGARGSRELVRRSPGP